MKDCFEKVMSESQVDGGTESIDSRAPPPPSVHSTLRLSEDVRLMFTTVRAGRGSMRTREGLCNEH